MNQHEAIYNLSVPLQGLFACFDAENSGVLFHYEEPLLEPECHILAGIGTMVWKILHSETELAPRVSEEGFWMHITTLHTGLQKLGSS